MGTESNARKAKGRRHERADESAGHHKGAAQKSADKCAHRKMGAHVKMFSVHEKQLHLQKALLTFQKFKNRFAIPSQSVYNSTCANFAIIQCSMYTIIVLHESSVLQNGCTFCNIYLIDVSSILLLLVAFSVYQGCLIGVIIYFINKRVLNILFQFNNPCIFKNNNHCNLKIS